MFSFSVRLSFPYGGKCVSRGEPGKELDTVYVIKTPVSEASRQIL